MPRRACPKCAYTMCVRVCQRHVRASVRRVRAGDRLTGVCASSVCAYVPAPALVHASVRASVCEPQSMCSRRVGALPCTVRPPAVRPPACLRARASVRAPRACVRVTGGCAPSVCTLCQVRSCVASVCTGRVRTSACVRVCMASVRALCVPDVCDGVCPNVPAQCACTGSAEGVDAQAV